MKLNINVHLTTEFTEEYTQRPQEKYKIQWNADMSRLAGLTLIKQIYTDKCIDHKCSGCAGALGGLKHQSP